MHRFAAGEAFAKASKPRVERRMSILNVGVKIEEVLPGRKVVLQSSRETYIHIAYNAHEGCSELRIPL